MDNIPVKIILDPDNKKSDSVSVLQLLNKSGLNITYHCKDGYCGSCKIKKTIDKNTTIKNNQDVIAFFDRDTEILACVSVLDKKVSQLTPEGLLELNFIVPHDHLGKGLKEKILSGELTDGKMWVFDFANRTSSIKKNTINTPSLFKKKSFKNNT